MVEHDPALMAKLPKSYLQEYIGERLTIVSVIFLVVQTIAVVLFYSSRNITRTLKGIDCWLFMPLGYVFSAGLCLCGILMVQIGSGGHHLEAVLLQHPSGDTLIVRSKIDKVVEMIDYAAISGAKLVILTLYMRIFSADRRYRIATYVVGAIILANWFAVVIASATACRPFNAYWNFHIRGATCDFRSGIQIWKFVSVPNIATDVMMLVLPLPALYKLHVDIMTKIGLFATFLVGSVGMITSILRMVAFMKVEDFLRDPTYKCIPTMMYTIAEASTYLIASCMPALRPLKRHFFGDHSFTRSIGLYFNKNSRGVFYSWRLKTSERDAQLNVQQKETVEMFKVEKDSNSHTESNGFMKLDSNSDLV